jgi:gamma-glutamyl-gamma-aminobutyrate hydrolase PuuD
MPKVYIVGGNGQNYGQMFLNAGWELAKGPLKADLIQFTGGEDVTPALYGEGKHPYTGNSFERDLYEAGYFATAKRMGIPMAGICRGGQFLNVMSGGKMYQHVDGHATGHNHTLYDIRTEREVVVSSTHHQMMIASRSGEILAYANEASRRETFECKSNTDGEEPDTEAVYYADTKALCYQPHPEFFGPEHECFQYYFELIERCHGLRA